MHDPEFLVADVLPKEFAALEVNQIARHDNRSLAGLNVNIGKIRGKNKIIRLDRGTEQQGAQIPDRCNQVGKETGTLEEDTFFSTSCRTHVAVTIKHGEHVSVLQYPGQVVSRRRARRYVVLLEDSNFIQLNTPSETVSGAVCPSTSLE